MARAQSGLPHKIVYVSDSLGDDNNPGSRVLPKATIQAAVSALPSIGGAVRLRRGDTWIAEAFAITKPNVTVKAYGSGANPLIDGNAATFGIRFSARNGRLEHVDVTNSWHGARVDNGGSLIVIGGVFTANGAGIAATAEAHLTLVSGVNCNGSLFGGFPLMGDGQNGSGDGIQVSDGAGTGRHNFHNITCTGNEKMGLNLKEGTCFVRNSVLSDNDEAGLTAQNALISVQIENSVLSGNNVNDGGNGNVSIENTCTVISRRNTYKNPTSGVLNATLNVFIKGTANLFKSYADVYEMDGVGSAVGSVKAVADASPNAAEFYNCTFDHRGGTGNNVCIDALSATAFSLIAKNCVFHTDSKRAVRLSAGSTRVMDYNHYHRTAGVNALLQVDIVDYNQTQIGDGTAFAATGLEEHGTQGDPTFTDGANSDFTLQAGSPCEGTGIALADLTKDFNGNVFSTLSTPPNKGAYA